MDERHPLTLFNLATTYFSVQQYEKAVHYYEILEGVKSGDPRINFNMAMSYEQLH